MNLYIVRHTYADSGSPDAERNLTEIGRKKLEETIPEWKSYVPQIDIVLSSPFKRAIQTAEIIHKSYNISKDIVVDKGLQPGMSTGDVLITVDALSYNDIMIVGHMPDVSDLVSDLVSPVSFGYPFSPGTLAAIEFNGEIKIGSGKLKLLMPLKK